MMEVYDFSKSYKTGGYHIPEYMMPGIERYVTRGVIPGDFLQAIICNDLGKAVAHGDDVNIRNISAFVRFFYNQTPTSCWGSKEAMKAWSKKGGSNAIGE